jgi:hypothetical protein
MSIRLSIDRTTRRQIRTAALCMLAVILLTAGSIFIGERMAGGSLRPEAPPAQHQGGKNGR